MSGVAVCVGLDLGTSSIKAAAIDAAGRVLARARHEYATSRGSPGAAEQDPSHWWRASIDALTELAGRVPPARWAAIGLSAMLPTLIALNAQHDPVAPAITWQDGRGEPAGAALRRSVGGDELYRRTGQWVDGRYLLPMMRSLTERDPRVATEARTMAGAKDYLHWLLTGQLLTDPSTAAGYGCYELGRACWDETIDVRWSRPPVLPSNTATPLRAELAQRLGLPPGLPVVLGAADSVLGAFAAGARHPGDIGYLSGTSTVVLACRDEPALDRRHRYLLTPAVGTPYAAEMDLLATGAAMDWLANLVGLPGGASELAALAQRVPAAGCPTFLPYLAPGEQGALWDADLSGALLGLRLGHNRADIARALLTGIVIESSRCLRVLDETAGADAPHGDVFAAGLAMSEPFAQDLADASGRRVTFDPAESAHSALGAARLAASTLGIGDMCPAPQAIMVEPDPDRRAQWDELFQIHEAARTASGHAATGGRRR